MLKCYSVSLVHVSVLGALCLLSLVSQSNSAVISIDFSGEWIKIALVKPGVPMEIVLNKESKRKTAAIVALRNEERMFSDAAMSTAIKYPKNAYQYLQFIAGLQYDNPLVQKYKEWFPYYDIKKDEARNTLVFQHSDDLSFTTEELIAMLLNNSRELAQDYAGVPIKNAVITVPPFYTQAQRKSILLAAQLVGLNVLQLITDSAAAALNYGVFRRNSFNSTATYMMFFDMGATSTTVSVVEYKKVQVKEGGTAHIEPQLATKGVGFDRTLGGLEMDMRMRNHLAKIFTAKHKTKKPIYESPRAMAKLLKEARRVKMVLSANVDHVARIEGLHEEIDFSTKVSREEFEEMCADLFDRIEEPLKQALKISEVTMSEIESVLLVGGGTRVPKVQETLLRVIKRSELGKNLNTDEAAALGAVYQAASLSKLFRVKKFIIKESNVYPIQVSFDKPVVDPEGNPSTKTITRTLFNMGNPYPQKKILTFNRYNEDFSFSVFYGKLDFLSEQQQSYIGPLNLTSIALNGIVKALEANKGSEPGGVKAHFRMDENGLLLLESVQSHFEHEIKEEPSTFSKITNAFSNLFGGSESEEEGKDVKSETGNENTTEGDTIQPSSPPPPPQEEEGEKGADSGETDEANGGETEADDNKHDTSEEEPKKDSKEEETQQKDTDDTPVEEEDKGDDDDGDKVGDDSQQESNINEEEEQFEEEEEEEEDSDEEEIPDIDEQESKDEKQTTTEEKQTTGGAESSTDEDATGQESDDTSKETKPPSSEEEKGESGDSSTSKKKAEESPSVKKRKKESDGPKTETVKVNITADVSQMDWYNLTEEEMETSASKLKWLQQRDEDKRQNEIAKNSLESHVFEFTDFMYSEEASVYSTEEERTEIIKALTKAGEWLEEEGFNEETDVYKQKLRELKRTSKPLMRRIEEASKRPNLFAQLFNSINISIDFLVRMRNYSELEIFTDVEVKTLTDVTKESQVWLLDAETKQNATKPHEDPVILCSEIEDKIRKLDREIMYLMNKVKNYKPKKPKTTPVNATNTTSDAKSTTNKTKIAEEEEIEPKNKETKDSDQPGEQQTKKKDKKTSSETEEEEEEEEEILELPPADGGDSSATKESSTSDDHSEL